MSEYIKREDAIRDLQIFASYIENPDYMVSKSVLRVLKGLPSIEVVERKRGKWIKDADGCMVCSECGNPDEINGITGEFMGSNFCNECGADMRGAE